jgi:hypothetical protein
MVRALLTPGEFDPETLSLSPFATRLEMRDGPRGRAVPLTNQFDLRSNQALAADAACARICCMNCRIAAI